jgi:hypothetical protein
VVSSSARHRPLKLAAAVFVGGLLLLTIGFVAGWELRAQPAPLVGLPSESTAPTSTSAVGPVRESWEGWGEDAGVTPGVALEPSGSVIIDEDGAELVGVEVAGTVLIDADDVLIEDVKVLHSGGPFAIRINEGRRNVVLRNVTVVGSAGCEVGIYGEGYTADAVDVSQCVDGLRVGTATTVVNSNVHDLLVVDGGHNDAVQSLGGVGLVLRNNRLEGVLSDGRNASAAVQLDGRVNPPLADVVIEANLFIGGAYSLRVYNAAGSVLVSNNRFDGTWDFGPAVVNTDVEWETNLDVNGDEVQPVTD